MPHWLRWVAGVAAACAVIAAWQLLGDVRPITAQRASRLSAQAERLREEYNGVQAQWRRLVRLDSARGRVPAAPGLVVDLGADASPDLVARITAAAESEYSPATRPRASVLILGLHARGGDEPRQRLVSTRGRLDFLAGTERGIPFCAVIGEDAYVRSFSPRTIERLSRQSLGPCRLWARYGAPGAGVARWLAAGGMDFTRDGRVLAPMADSLRMRRLFGARHTHQKDLALYGCQSGNARRCRQELLQPRPRERAVPGESVMASEAEGWIWAALPPWQFSQHLFAALEAEFGAERVAGFWSSPDDVESAFRQAFGLPMETWTVRWLQEISGQAPTGPRLAGPTLLLSLVGLGLLVGAAIVTAHRRTAG